MQSCVIIKVGVAHVKKIRQLIEMIKLDNVKDKKLIH